MEGFCFERRLLLLFTTRHFTFFVLLSDFSIGLRLAFDQAFNLSDASFVGCRDVSRLDIHDRCVLSICRVMSSQPPKPDTGPSLGQPSERAREVRARSEHLKSLLTELTSRAIKTVVLLGDRKLCSEKFGEIPRNEDDVREINGVTSSKDSESTETEDQKRIDGVDFNGAQNHSLLETEQQEQRKQRGIRRKRQIEDETLDRVTRKWENRKRGKLKRRGDPERPKKRRKGKGIMNFWGNTISESKSRLRKKKRRRNSREFLRNLNLKRIRRKTRRKRKTNLKNIGNSELQKKVQVKSKSLNSSEFRRVKMKDRKAKKMMIRQKRNSGLKATNGTSSTGKTKKGKPGQKRKQKKTAAKRKRKQRLSYQKLKRKYKKLKKLVQRLLKKQKMRMMARNRRRQKRRTTISSSTSSTSRRSTLRSSKSSFNSSSTSSSTSPPSSTSSPPSSSPPVAADVKASMHRSAEWGVDVCPRSTVLHYASTIACVVMTTLMLILIFLYFLCPRRCSPNQRKSSMSQSGTKRKQDRPHHQQQQQQQGRGSSSSSSSRRRGAMRLELRRIQGS